MRRSSTNDWGFVCEEKIRDILPLLGIPHKFQKCADDKDWFWWANHFEDQKCGVDCWLTLDLVEYPVDFTVVSPNNGTAANDTSQKALERGVIPIFLSQATIIRADEGSEPALEELGREIRCQIALKKNQLQRKMLVRQAPPRKFRSRPKRARTRVARYY